MLGGGQWVQDGMDLNIKFIMLYYGILLNLVTRCLAVCTQAVHLSLLRSTSNCSPAVQIISTNFIIQEGSWFRTNWNRSSTCGIIGALNASFKMFLIIKSWTNLEADWKENFPLPIPNYWILLNFLAVTSFHLDWREVRTTNLKVTFGPSWSITSTH